MFSNKTEREKTGSLSLQAPKHSIERVNVCECVDRAGYETLVALHVCLLRLPSTFTRYVCRYMRDNVPRFYRPDLRLCMQYIKTKNGQPADKYGNDQHTGVSESQVVIRNL